MKITGIIFLIIGILTLGYLIFDVFDPNGREEIIPFLSQTWAAIIATFTISAGAALMVASKKKYSRREKESINA